MYSHNMHSHNNEIEQLELALRQGSVNAPENQNRERSFIGQNRTLSTPPVRVSHYPRFDEVVHATVESVG